MRSLHRLKELGRLKPPAHETFLVHLLGFPVFFPIFELLQFIAWRGRADTAAFVNLYQELAVLRDCTRQTKVPSAPLLRSLYSSTNPMSESSK